MGGGTPPAAILPTAVIAALVLIGAPGTGKSSVLEALMSELERAGVAYGAIESEQLAMGWPLLDADAWATQLEAVLALQREQGRQLFLVVATTENARELRSVQHATRAERSLIVCLSAPPDTVARRLEAREPDRWPGKLELIAHARSLARSMPQLEGIELVINTERRTAAEAAEEIRDAMRAAGLFGQG